MKKLLIRVFLGIAVLVILAVVGLGLFLDRAIQHGIETLGPRLTKAPVTVDGVALSVLSGKGALKGFVLGNPEGYRTPFAMKLGSATLAIQPSSLLSEKVVVRSINVQGAELSFEGDLGGNNLSQLQKNVDAAVGGSAPAAPAEEDAGGSKKLQVDEFVFAGAKVAVTSSLLAGKSVVLNLPDIRLENLGTGPDGITAADLTKALMSQITAQTVKAVAAEISRGGKEAVGAAAEAGKQGLDEAKKAAQGVTDLFKKKK